MIKFDFFTCNRTFRKQEFNRFNRYLLNILHKRDDKVRTTKIGDFRHPLPFVHF